MATLYQKLGGEAAISAVVDKFYEFMLADTEIRHFFVTTDMNKQRCRQKQFITLVTGGPHNYEGADMKTAHCKLKVSKQHFDVSWKHLHSAVLHFKVPLDLIEELKAIFYSVEGDVVTVPSGNPVPQASLSNQNAQKSEGCPVKASSELQKMESEASKEGASKEGGSKEGGSGKLSKNPYMKQHY